MTKVLVTRKIPDIGIAMLREAGHEVDAWAKDDAIPRRELLKRAKGAHGILSLLTDRIDAEVLEAAGPQLKIVANYAVGYDNLDLAALKARGVKAANTPGILTAAVAEHAFALMMACAKRIPEADRFVRAGRYKGWEPELLLGMELSGKTLGVIGTGRIGAQVVQRAVRGMNMKALYHDVRRNEALERDYGAEFAEAEEVLRRADIVSLHVPLLPSTRHLIDAARLGMMKRTAILINTARGPVVDEKALVGALKAGRIAYAGLDVYEDEPKLAPGLIDLPNVVLTPHTASATIETRTEMAKLAAGAVVEVLAGREPANLIKD